MSSEAFIHYCVSDRTDTVDTVGDKTQPSYPPDGILEMLTAYQKCVRYILNQHDFPGVTAEELEFFKKQFRLSAFTCRIKFCPRATVGFDSAQVLREHELSHVCQLRCAFPGCHYPPFPSAQALRRHERRVHQRNLDTKPIRRVGRFGQKKPDESPERIDKESQWLVTRAMSPWRGTPNFGQHNSQAEASKHKIQTIKQVQYTQDLCKYPQYGRRLVSALDC